VAVGIGLCVVDVGSDLRVWEGMSNEKYVGWGSRGKGSSCATMVEFCCASVEFCCGAMMEFCCVVRCVVELVVCC
jgi:hypothetical protein